MSLAEQHEWLSRPITRRGLLRAAAGVGVSSVLLWEQSASARARATEIYGRHSAFGADPATEMIVGFASRLPVRRAIVRLDNEQAAEAEGQTVPGSQSYYLRARLRNLRPATDYHYTLDVDGVAVDGGRFRTAPDGDAAFRFTAFGDQDVFDGAAAVLNQVARAKPLLHVLAGDLCYADTSGRGGPGDVFKSAKWDRWLAQNERVTSQLPWMVVPGNHEMEPGFAVHGYAGMLSRFAFGGRSPVGVPVATSFRVGTVGFVGLDSNDVSNEIPANRGWTGSRQTAWLAQELERYRGAPDIDFIVVFFHASPYCTSNAHGSEGGVRDQWVPIFDRYAVDLVISGHNHCYQRALPLRAGDVVSQNVDVVDGAAGTTYVTVGGGGAFFDGRGFGSSSNSTRVATRDGPHFESAPWSRPPHIVEHCFLVADVTPGDASAPPRMRLRAVTSTGTTIDEWQIVRHRPKAEDDHNWLWPAGAATLAGLGMAGVGGATAIRHRRRSDGREQEQ